MKDYILEELVDSPLAYARTESFLKEDDDYAVLTPHRKIVSGSK